MTTDAQKLRERGILDIYCAAIGISAHTVTASERPDFIVNDGSQNIGIEVTEYFQPRSPGESHTPAQVESAWAALRERAYQHQTSDTRIRNFSVYLKFNTRLVPKPSEYDHFIGELYALLPDTLSRSASRYVEIAIGQTSPKLLRKYLRSIRFEYIGACPMWMSNLTVGWVGTSEAELVAIISPKLSLPKPAFMDELHLVIFGGGSTVGSYIGYISQEQLTEFNDLSSKLHSGSFDKVSIITGDASCLWHRNAGWTNIRLNH